MDPESLVARTGAVCQLARAIQENLVQVVWVRFISGPACPTEIKNLVDTLLEIETVYAANPNLAQAAFLSVRLESLNSTLTVLRELLADTGDSAQVEKFVFSLSRPQPQEVWKKDEVQRMMLRIREERAALTVALCANITYV